MERPPPLNPSDPVNLLDSKRAEEVVGQVLHAQLVTDRATQLRDIDLIKGGVTYSVKYQKTAYRTLNFSFEVVQATADFKQTVPGNFTSGEADKYALLFPIGPDTLGLLVLDSKKLKAFVEKPHYRRTWLTQAAVETNIRRGNKYVQAQSVLVPIQEVYAITDRANVYSIPLKVTR